jgi:hypothetical protein
MNFNMALILSVLFFNFIFEPKGWPTDAQTPIPAPSPNVSSSPNASPHATPHSTPHSTSEGTAAGLELSKEVHLSDVDKKKIATEYEQAQSMEVEALKHRQKIELEEIKASHLVRRKEWEEREKQAWIKFQDEHESKKDRAEFIKGKADRKKILEQLFKQEVETSINSSKARIKATIQDQENKKREFEQSLKKGVRPAEALWPKFY